MSRPDLTHSDQDEFVKAELSRFILEHTGMDALSSIDEIVLSYIIGVLESLETENSPEEAFDVTEFVEMMSAYIPAFSNINRSHVCEWMFYLAEWMKKELENSKNRIVEEVLFKAHERQRSVSENAISHESKHQYASHSRRKSFSSRSCSSSQSDDEERCINVSSCDMSTELNMLLEMFPHLHLMEVKQILCMADRDCEKAVQLILQKQECDQLTNDSLVTKSLAKPKVNATSDPLTTDKKLRDQILERYAYIDQVDDVREHKPITPKTEPKKLIRYRDNKIVSIKGERYSEVKRDTTEDAKDKIIPTKKYRLQ